VQAVMPPKRRRPHSSVGDGRPDLQVQWKENDDFVEEIPLFFFPSKNVWASQKGLPSFKNQPTEPA
jgi:hypothetical protein